MSLQDNIHLTPVSTLVHMHSVMPYLDAATEQERAARMQATGANAGASGSKDAAPARALHMTLKSAMEESGGTETMSKRLQAIHLEPWSRMKVIGDDTDAAWEAYLEHLLHVGERADPPEPQDASKADKGKGVAVTDEDDGTKATDARESLAGAPDLAERVTRLRSAWVEKRMRPAVDGEKKTIVAQPKPEVGSSSDAPRLATNTPGRKGGADVTLASAANASQRAPRGRAGVPAAPAPEPGSAAASTPATKSVATGRNEQDGAIGARGGRTRPSARASRGIKRRLRVNGGGRASGSAPWAPMEID